MSNTETTRRLSIVSSNVNQQHPEPLIDAEEASRYLGGYKPITILRMARKGLLPTIAFPVGQTGKFRYMFRLSELESHVNTLSRPAAAA